LKKTPSAFSNPDRGQIQHQTHKIKLKKEVIEERRKQEKQQVKETLQKALQAWVCFMFLGRKREVLARRRLRWSGIFRRWRRTWSGRVGGIITI
jgi:hypothetical protein